MKLGCLMGATGKQKTWVVWRFGTPDDKDYKRQNKDFYSKWPVFHQMLWCLKKSVIYFAMISIKWASTSYKYGYNSTYRGYNLSYPLKKRPFIGGSHNCRKRCSSSPWQLLYSAMLGEDFIVPLVAPWNESLPTWMFSSRRRPVWHMATWWKDAFLGKL